MVKTAHLWVIYDERAMLQNTDECSVLESCSSLADVRRSDFNGKAGPLGVVFEYDIEPPNTLVNERRIGTVAEVRNG